MADEAVLEDIPTDDDTGVDDKARELGWRPREEWDGPTTGWMDSEEFLARNDRLKKKADPIAQKEITRLETKLSEMETSLTDLTRMYTNAEKRGYDRALKDITKRQEKAVEEGDTDAFKAAQAEADELKQEMAEGKPEAKAPSTSAMYDSFVKQNDWYNDDEEMTVYADQVAPVVARKLGIKQETPEFYERVAEAVKRKFPDKFENPNRKRASAVEAGGAAAGSGKSKWPAEAKAAYDRFVKQGKSGPYPDGDTKQNREQFIRDYENA